MIQNFRKFLFVVSAKKVKKILCADGQEDKGKVVDSLELQYMI